MRESDLQKVGVMVCVLIFIIAPALPFAGLCLVVLWAGVLAFDSIENKNPRRVMPDA